MAGHEHESKGLHLAQGGEDAHPVEEHEGHGDGGHGGEPHEEHEEHEGAPEWLISFADNVTLMMGFFVILLAINMKPAGGAAPTPGTSTPAAPDVIDAAIAIREAFNNPVDVAAPRPEDVLLVRRVLERQAQAQDQGADGRHDQTQSLQRGTYHSPVGLVFFEEGSAELTDAGRESLDRLAEHVRGLKLRVEVRGHASAAEAYGTDDDGMRLSFERAFAVASRLVEKEIAWSQLRPVPCGSAELATPHAYDRQTHATNARVEVMLLEEVPG